MWARLDPLEEVAAEDDGCGPKRECLGADRDQLGIDLSLLLGLDHVEDITRIRGVKLVEGDDLVRRWERALAALHVLLVQRELALYGLSGRLSPARGRLHPRPTSTTPAPESPRAHGTRTMWSPALRRSPRNRASTSSTRSQTMSSCWLYGGSSDWMTTIACASVHRIARADGSS